MNGSWKISSLAVNGQSFLVIDGYLLNPLSSKEKSCRLTSSIFSSPLVWSSFDAIYLLPSPWVQTRDVKKQSRSLLPLGSGRLAGDSSIAGYPYTCQGIGSDKTSFICLCYLHHELLLLLLRFNLSSRRETAAIHASFDLFMPVRL